MPGYSGAPLERKLGVKPGHAVFLDRAPDGFDLAAQTRRRLPQLAWTSASPSTPGEPLEKRLPKLIKRTEQAGTIWVCWPKRSAIGKDSPFRPFRR